MCGRFGSLMGPRMVGNGRYANPRDRLKQRNGYWGHFWGGVPDIRHKNRDAGENGVLGCMCGRFGALMGPPMVGNGRYANPR